MAAVLMYASAYCGYCRRARVLLDGKGVDYTLIDVDGDPLRWQEMRQRSGRNTVPQIFIDGVPVGGFSDLSALEQAGELDRLLGRK